VAAIVKDQDDQARILPSLENLGINNLRIVTKTQMAVDRFNRELSAIARPSPDSPASRDARQRILENVAKISILYWMGHNELDPKNLVNRYSILISRGVTAARRTRGDDSKGFEETNPLAQVLVDLAFEDCKADTLIVDYLRSGKIKKGLLQQAFFSERSELETNSRRRTIESFFDAYYSSFSEISVNLLDEAERLIGQETRFLSVEEIHFIVPILQASKRVCDPTQVERHWASTWVGADSIPDDERARCLETLVDGEARATLQSRFPRTKSADEFDGFAMMLIHNRLSRDLLASSAYADADSLFEDLKKANHPSLMGKIKDLYVALTKLDNTDPLIPFRTALEEALQRLSRQNDLNARRIERIFAEPVEPRSSDKGSLLRL